MSLRQIRKLKEAQENAPELPIDEEGDESPVRPKRTVFSKAAFAESSESSSSEDEAPAVRPEGTAALAGPSKRVTSKPSPVVKTSVPKASVRIVSDPSLKLEISKLNPRSELKRIFGSSEQRSSTRMVKRRHWLVEPEKSWPLVVKDVFKMEVCSDGSFRLVPETNYEAKLHILSRIIITHDIEALYHFVEMNPFHPHGLLQLASILIEQRSEFENAYHLVRRALYAYQSAFPSTFHPGQTLILSPDSIFSASLLRALLLYSHLLAGQGCVRTSLEIIKLVYAMDGGMLTGCPRTHALAHIDVAAWRCGEIDWLSSFIVSNRLSDVLPSSSLMLAICQKQKGIDESISGFNPKAKVCEETPATSALVRTILAFPGIVKQIIGKEIPDVERNASILTNKLIQAFVSKGGVAAVKADESLVAWVNDVVEVTLPKIIQMTGIRSIPPVTPDWMTRGYSDITSAEFVWGKSAAGSFVEPAPLLESEAQVLEIYSAGEYVVPAASTTSAPSMHHAVSLESNPLAAFFQTLLPWSSIDTTGTESTPVTARGFLEQLRSSLGIHAPTDDTYDPVIQDATDDQEPGDVEEEEEEEINAD